MCSTRSTKSRTSGRDRGKVLVISAVYQCSDVERGRDGLGGGGEECGVAVEVVRETTSSSVLAECFARVLSYASESKGA